MLLLDEPFGMLDSLTRYELQGVLMELWARNQLTALMVTHDVDEALFLSDRIVMMTNGPEAFVGEVMEITWPRPRDRRAVMEHPDYYRRREELIEFLNVRAYTLKGQTPKHGHAESPAAPGGAKPTAKAPVTPLANRTSRTLTPA